MIALAKKLRVVQVFILFFQYTQLFLLHTYIIKNDAKKKTI